MSSSNGLSPAADMLLKQFFKAGDDIIARAQPQDSLGPLLSEPRFCRCLDALRLLVGHALPGVVRQLEGWRAAKHTELKRLPERTDRERLAALVKRSALEVVYFEGSLQLLEEYDDSFLESNEFVAFYDSLQKVSFQLLLVTPEDVMPPGTDHYRAVVGVAARTLGAISRRVSLAHVVDPFLKALTERINPKKDAQGNKPNYDVLRTQIVRLAGGMRHVALSFDSEEAVAESVAFLRRAFPLGHTAPIKKSQIHHALCDMLSSILLPLVRSDAPQRAAAALGPAPLEPWYAAVAAAGREITSWMNKHPKHINDGYPLATTLVCLANDRDYSTGIDTTAEFLHKGLKVKENRSVCVRCLVVLCCSYLVRYGADSLQPMPKHELHKWLDKALKPVTALAKKGGLTIQEQLDTIAPLAELSPEFALQYLVLDLLTSDTPDCVVAGLKALQALVLSAPAFAAATAAGAGASGGGGTGGGAVAGPGGAGAGPPVSATHRRAPSGVQVHHAFAAAAGSSGGGGAGAASLASSGSSSGLQALLLRRTPTPLLSTLASLGGPSLAPAAGAAATPAAASSSASAAAAAAVIDLLRRGLHPLDALGVSHLLPRVTAALASLLKQWHPHYGSYYSYSTPDPNWREKTQGFSMLVALVRLLPYLKPDTWPNVRPLEVLPSYTCHAEPAMRSTATEALQAVVRGSPHLRNNVLCAFGAFVAALPDDAVQSQREAQALQRQLADTWLGLLAERAAGDAQEAASPGVPPDTCLALDVARLEGCALVCLASHDEGVRREALQALSQIRTLHQAVLAADPYDEPPPSPQRPAAAAAIPRNASTGGLASSVQSSHGSLPAGGSAANHHLTHTGQSLLLPQGGHSGSVSMHQLHVHGHSQGAVLHGHSQSHPPQHGSYGGRESLDLGGGSEAAAAVAGLRSSVAGLTGLSELPEPEHPYVVELIEESGPALLRSTYWDLGDWGDTWRAFRAVPEDVTFQDVLLYGGPPGGGTPRGGGGGIGEDSLPRLRLPRALLSLMCLAARMAPQSAGVAGCELMGRLSRMLGRSTDGRLVVMPEYLETPKREAWRNCSAMACACPQTLKDRVQERLGKRPPPISMHDLIQVHLSLVAGAATGRMQLSSIMCLGHLHPEYYQWLMDDLRPLAEEAKAAAAAGAGGSSSSKSKAKSRGDELRRCVAHVFRILSEAAPPELWASHALLRGRTLEWVRDSALLLRPMTLSGDAFWDNAQVAYCLAAVVRNCAAPLLEAMAQQLLPGPQQQQGGGAGPAVGLRKGLWELLVVWTEEAFILLPDIKAVVAAVPPSEAAAALRASRCSNYLRALDKGINAALARYKESPEALREELYLASHYINHAARQALAALMEGPVFEPDTRRPQGPVLTWVDKLLAVAVEGPQQVEGPARRSVGRRALRGLLTHNPDLFDTCLDKAYDTNTSIANGYFQVLCEVYATHPTVRTPPHVILALVLYKLVDREAEVREDAMHMLHVLTLREWPETDGSYSFLAAAPNMGAAAAAAAAARAAGGADGSPGAHGLSGGAGGGEGGFVDDPVVVLGTLQDSYQRFQLKLSAHLASVHKELSEALCEELMTRQLGCSEPATQQPVLTSLAPWLENLAVSFPWRGTWCERLLKSMYLVTRQHGGAFPVEVEGLWTQLARRTRNINPILDFLLSLGMDTALQELGPMLDFFAVGKRIVLFLARVSPPETIGYLAIELAKQQLEPEPGGGGGGPGGGASGRLAGRVAAGRQGGQQQGAAAALTFGTSLDAVVLGDTRASSQGDLSSTAYLSASGGGGGGSAFTPSAAVPSNGGGGGAGSTSARSLDAGGSLAVGGPGSAAATAAAAAGLHRAHSGRSEASVGSSSRSDVNGGGGGASSVADSAATHPRTGQGLAGTSWLESKLRWEDEAGGAVGVGGHPHAHSGPSAPSPAPSASGVRALLTRPELVLCCLTEVLYEHDVDPQHLPLLLHVALTCADHEEGVVAAHCTQLVVNLVDTVAAKHLERAGHPGGSAHASSAGDAATPRGAAAASTPSTAAAAASPAAPNMSAVTSLIRYLQSLRGRRLWPCEDYSLAGAAAVAAAADPRAALTPSAASLCSLTVAVTDALSYEPDLAMEWAQRALDWAQHARSRHLACRSWQVLRALRPPLTADLAAGLVLSLEACFLAGQPAGREVAVEVIATTRVLVESLPPGRLVVYPQVWWSALALLHSPHVAVYRGALGLLRCCLEGGQLRLGSAKVQAVLLAAAPGTMGGGAAQLLAGAAAAVAAEGAEDADPWALGQYLLGLDPRERGAASSPPAPGLGGPALGPLQHPLHGSLAVQQLLLRGLLHPLTAVPTLELLATLAEALHHQASVLLMAGPGGPMRASQDAHPHGHGQGHGHPMHTGASHHRGASMDQGPRPGAGAAPLGPFNSLPPELGLAQTDIDTAPVSDSTYGDTLDTYGKYDRRGGGGTRGGRGALGSGSGGSALGMTLHSDSLRKHRALKLDSFQTLLGSCKAQLFVSLMGIMPLALSLHGAGPGGAGVGGGGLAAGAAGEETRNGGGGRSGAGGAGGAGAPPPPHVSRAAREELQGALLRAVGALGRAAVALGVGDVSEQLHLMSTVQVAQDPDALQSLTTQLCAHINRALFPRYAAWYLHHIADLLAAALGAPALGTATAPSSAAPPAAPSAPFTAPLPWPPAALAQGCTSMPPAPRQVRAALLMLTCMFQVRGLRLGPAAAALVADGGVLQPVVALAGGPLAPHATEALQAVWEFTRRDGGYQQDLDTWAVWQQRAEAGRQGGKAGGGGVGGTGGGGGGGAGVVVGRSLFPPPTPVAGALKRVVDTLGSGLRGGRRKKLLPFLAASYD